MHNTKTALPEIIHHGNRYVVDNEKHQLQRSSDPQHVVEFNHLRIDELTDIQKQLPEGVDLNLND